jgi:hypothetical protein
MQCRKQTLDRTHFISRNHEYGTSCYEPLNIKGFSMPEVTSGEPFKKKERGMQCYNT